MRLFVRVHCPLHPYAPYTPHHHRPPPCASRHTLLLATGTNPMPVRYRLSNLCSLFGEEEGEAETCKKEGFKRYAGPKALQARAAPRT